MRPILKIIMTISLLLLAVPGFARSRHHRPLPKDSLVDIAADVSLAFRPEYHIEKNSVEIKGPYTFREGVDFSISASEEFKRNQGREYYIVCFINNDAATKKDCKYISRVEIWKDTLEPLGIIYCLDDGWGWTFIFDSFEESARDCRQIGD